MSLSIRSFGKWLCGVILVIALYFLSLGPIGVLAFQNRTKLGKWWVLYRVYIEPVVASPPPIENLALNYMKSWCNLTKTQWPGDYTLD